MRELLSIEEIKKIEIEILKHFKEFCEKEKIQFFLSNGTLLGAIKYGGFIPWDDDIDVFVPREDYERLIRCYKDSEKYCLYSIERNSNFYYPFAKLCDRKTIKEEMNIDNGTVLGVDIDIFPLDSWTDNYNDAKKQVKSLLKKIRKLNFAKLKFNHGKSLLRTCVKTILIIHARGIGANRLIARIQRTVKLNMKSSKYCGCVVWPIYGEREIIPKEVFDGIIEVEFEGEKFPAPIGYDIYLRSLYGNYVNDPPIEKQKTHHIFTVYRL